MKTAVIQLEPHDDAISIRDKLGWNPAERIVLVWPGRGLDLSRLDLALIQRRASQLGAQLALVGAGASAREQARELRIPVFSSVKKAETKRWRGPRFVLNPAEAAAESAPAMRQARRSLVQNGAAARRAQPPFPTWAALAASALGLLAVLAILAVLAPRAEIRLAPTLQTQQAALELSAGAGIFAVSPPGKLPARQLAVVAEGRAARPTSGEIDHPASAASGQVVFTNLTQDALELPAGLVVRTAGEPIVRFATRQAARLEAGPGQTLTLAVQALTPGPSGNLPGGSLQAVEHPLGARLTVSNPAPTRGGSSRRLPAPSPADRSALHEELLASLRSSALEELGAQLNPGDVLIVESLDIRQTLLEASDPAGDEPADELSLTLRLEFSALAASAQDVQALAAAVLDDDLPDGYQALPGEIRIENLSAPDLLPNGQVAWEARAARTLQAVVDPQEAAVLVRGLPPDEAVQRLDEAFSLSEPAQITLWPSWWARLPLAPFRTRVIIEERAWP